MTSFSTQAVCGPVIGSLVAKDKGDASNRTKCAGAQLVNNVKTMGQAALVGGGVYGAARTFTKHPNSKVVQTGAKIFDKIINVTKLPKSNKFIDKLLKMPGKAKAFVLIALPALLAVDYIRSKHLYKMGQIDQKYTDQAKIEENTKKNILA